MKSRQIIAQYLYASLFLFILSAQGCKREMEELARLSELGAETREYVVSPDAGELNVNVLSNGRFNVLVSEDAEWMSPHASDLQGDTAFRVAYDANDGFPRMGLITLHAAESGRYDTIYVKQRGAKVPQLLFPTLNTTVLGDGGRVTSKLRTNIDLDDVDIQVIYPNDEQTDWVDGDFSYNTTDSLLSFTVKPNPSMDDLRSVQIRLSFTDGWGEQLVATLYLLQANAQNLFGTAATFPEIRLWAGERITSDLFIEGYVISDAGNKNMGDNLQTTPTAINYTLNDRTAYIQSVDGRYGFRIETATIQDNVFQRYGKVQLLLKGTTVEMETNPDFYTIKGVTSDKVMSQVQGGPGNLVRKEKYMHELTDDDIFTFVTLKDSEFPVRKGSFTPVNEGYTPLFNAHRITKYPLLMRDIRGNSMYLYTNMHTPYRRDGAVLPYGSGTISGIIVHEKFPRFEYEDAANEDQYGNIGRYQMRHVTRDDIQFTPQVENGFSELLAEYQYPNISAGVALPTHGGNGRITVSTGASIAATSDYSYLGPCGNNYLGNNNQYGTGVLINGMKQNTHANTNNDGKGGAAASGIAANIPWWNHERNRGEAWLVEFSTAGVSTDQLSLQLTAMNWASAGAGAPRYWKVEWSEHGNMDGVWTAVAKYTVPDAPNWSNTLLHQLPAYKNMNFRLPSEMLGKPRVYLRLMVDKNLASNGNTYATEPIAGPSNCAIGYLAIRYNK
ncbi:DUF5689 domain-containing protein [Parapedobacter composti]|nr:DUF5689 domain-containing protein [Parapedobacter composti]